MKKIVLTYGLISGAIIGGLSALVLTLCMNGTLDFDRSEVYGYTIMFLSFLLVFFAIRKYREETGGAITFGRAFKVGILVTLVTCAVYVAAWEIVYFGFMPDFGDKYATHLIEKMRAKGESAEKIDAKKREMERFKEIYKNPLVNVGITFMEIFPMGLVVTLVSAAALRKKPAGA